MTERPVVWRADARIWLAEESRRERRPVSLGSVPASSLEVLADLGFRWVWLNGIWHGGALGREVHQRRPETLDLGSDLGFETEDIVGSPDVPAAYGVSEEMGGDDGLEALRGDLARLDLRLLLDFLPGRVALDHPWVEGRPELLLRGRDEDAAREPARFWRSPGGAAFARARDRGGEPLPDCLQPNFRHPALRGAVLAELEAVALRADGVCVLDPAAADPMALGDSWGDLSIPGDGTAPSDGDFWAEAVARVRARAPHVILVANGPGAPADFDLATDDDLPALLLAGDPSAVRRHLARSGPSVRFLEAPGGPRAAHVYPQHLHFASALLAYLSGGAALFADGQIDGRKRSESPLYRRRPEEPADREVRAFYEALLEILGRPEVSRGRWELLVVREAWDGNASWRNFVVFLHRGEAGEALLTAVNLGPVKGQCYVDLSLLDPAGREWIFQDLLSVAVYARDGNDLSARGLYLDLPPWDYNVFEVLRGRTY